MAKAGHMALPPFQSVFADRPNTYFTFGVSEGINANDQIPQIICEIAIVIHHIGQCAEINPNSLSANGTITLPYCPHLFERIVLSIGLSFTSICTRIAW
jgi:hypothetical protein